MADDDQETTDTPDVPDGHETPDAEHPNDEPDENAETFPRSYVEKLRKENQGYRQRANTAEARVDELSRALWAARVEATGEVENAAEVRYNADIADDADAITEAVHAAVSERPYIAKRKVSGSVGQGVTGSKDEPFSLLGRLQRSV